jgi:hypothetical protein
VTANQTNVLTTEATRELARMRWKSDMAVLAGEAERGEAGCEAWCERAKRG